MEFDPALRYRRLPVVALVGRPNVGKSTLFNRLLHRRRAITGPTPGVTRDPVESSVFIAGKPVRLIDTGGFKLDRDTPGDGGSPAAPAGKVLDSLVVERTMEIIEEADLIVLLLEAGELTAEDEEFINLLRPRWKTLIAAVNKTEGGRLEGEAWNLLSYGFEKLILISAEHGDRVLDLEEAIVSRLDFSAVELDPGEPEKRPVALALLGKPNTGKSTLSNRLTASAASIVSEIPGTTRDVVEGAFRYKNRDFRVLDTAGIRRKSKVTENIEYYSVNRAVKTLEEADMVFLLIDALEGLTEQDKKIAALACDRGRGIILVLNKWDIMPRIKNALTAAKDKIHYFFGQMTYAPIVPISAADGTGVETLLETACRMYNQLCSRTDTAVLNRALARWIEEYPPPQGPRTRFKIKYAVQVSANPVQFVFFVSRPAAVTEAYRSYLCNRIRQDLGYSMVPVKLELRPSRKAE
ncbi:MAG: ribosome biogenesis GTPase Der [Spirochaetaceae bacterium]|jgi:GTP-binding protein|nr:ribosome biogenesis GTPase Der [Spirochaetaceae bacterium]